MNDRLLLSEVESIIVSSSRPCCEQMICVCCFVVPGRTISIESSEYLFDKEWMSVCVCACVHACVHVCVCESVYKSCVLNIT